MLHGAGLFIYQHLPEQNHAVLWVNIPYMEHMGNSYAAPNLAIINYKLAIP